MQDHVNDASQLLPFAELISSLGLSPTQQTAVLEGHQRELGAQEQRLLAGLDLQQTGLGPAPGATILPLREAVRRHLTAALERTRGKIYGPDGAAKLLDLKPTTLQSKLKKHGVDRLSVVGTGSGATQGSAEPSDADDEESSEPEMTAATSALALFSAAQ